MVKKALLGQVGDTDIRLLRIFKAIVECGGLAAAELELNIGRSTISRHLKDLEERIGLDLCHRGRGGFALTPDGRQVYDAAARLLAAMEDFRGEVRELHAEPVGTLSIGLFDKTVTNPQARIAEALRHFRRDAPEALVDVLVGTPSDIEAGVIEGRIHVGVIPDHRRSDRLRYANLFGEQMRLYCGRRHPLFDMSHAGLSMNDLQDFDYAGLGFHSPNLEASQRFHMRRKATATDQEAVASLVLSGCYVGFLPDHYAERFVDVGAMRRIEQPQCRYEVQFVAISRLSPPPPRLALAFLKALTQAHDGG
ncbi:LysR family transcriptional regulator [Variovorax sp. OV329]|uniref:LysR family transcriptional regulator n=1 Tax=Variovorax sp. OV329 TaxID=1882825 RepID=UPI0008E9F33C|nr:LysR family transcriptional regulator [Variovorax sp. OV329]SFM92966.1 transcriptional regulator, LysR family [Variovorax sp. OV329]